MYGIILIYPFLFHIASPLAFASRHHRPRLEPERLLNLHSFLRDASGPPVMTPSVAPSHAHTIA
jgi:hypothetical protein